MSDLQRPIEQGTSGIEKPTAPKPAEPPKEAQPLGAAEQQIVTRIDKDDDVDEVLRDIAGVQPQIGGEIVSPTAVRVDDPRNPDGSVNFKASQERGWLSAITSANAKRKLPEAVRGKNVQDIVDAAIAAGVPREQIDNHLQSLGVNTVRGKEAQQVQPEQPQDAQITTEVRAALDYVKRLAESVLAGRSQPPALQSYVDYSIRKGVPQSMIKEVLRTMGIPITEKSAAPAEAKPQFDAQKPIDGKTYNGLSKRFNDVRSRLLKEGAREKLDRLNGVPIGRILNGPFSGGDTVEAREAYKQISDLLDEVEGIGQPQLE